MSCHVRQYHAMRCEAIPCDAMRGEARRQKTGQDLKDRTVRQSGFFVGTVYDMYIAPRSNGLPRGPEHAVMNSRLFAFGRSNQENRITIEPAQNFSSISANCRRTLIATTPWCVVSCFFARLSLTTPVSPAPCGRRSVSSRSSTAPTSLGVVVELTLCNM